MHSVSFFLSLCFRSGCSLSKSYKSGLARHQKKAKNFSNFFLILPKTSENFFNRISKWLFRIKMCLVRHAHSHFGDKQFKNVLQLLVRSKIGKHYSAYVNIHSTDALSQYGLTLFLTRRKNNDLA